jgi:hypothetical protein
MHYASITIVSVKLPPMDAPQILVGVLLIQF